MKMLIGGTWQAAANGRTEDVTSPFDGTVVGAVPVAGPDDVDAALDRGRARRGHLAAHAGARADADPAARGRAGRRARRGRSPQTISAETGKTITEATGEAAPLG